MQVLGVLLVAVVLSPESSRGLLWLKANKHSSALCFASLQRLEPLLSSVSGCGCNNGYFFNFHFANFH